MTISCTGGHPVRTRFAPSPQGFLHIGWYRLLVFSWLLARHYGGQFLLRIEDTDQQRCMPGAVEHLIETLNWLGIDLDEGPIVGGSYGPYYQSQRLEIYARYAHQLIASGHAYRCFCPKERQNAMSSALQARRVSSNGYQRQCRYLTAEEIDAKLAVGESFIIRLKVPLEGVTCVSDVLRGEIEFQNSTLEDVVLLKSNGYATYHLACVVDDHLMKISHVLRSDMSLPSAPLHMIIYDALGWQCPLFAHIPPILGSDSKKLSVRHGAQPLLAYRNQGYLPETIIHYLALLGSSWDSRMELLSVPELQEAFDLDRVSRSSPILDEERMKWLNGVHIRKLSLSDLMECALPFLERQEHEGGLPDRIARPLDCVYLLRILSLAQERIKLLSELPPLTTFFFDDQLEYPAAWLIGKGLDVAKAQQVLTAGLGAMVGCTQWEAHALEERLRQLAAELAVKPGSLFMGIRVAVTGRKETPPLFETMEVLGRDRTLYRLQAAVARLTKGL